MSLTLDLNFLDSPAPAPGIAGPPLARSSRRNERPLNRARVTKPRTTSPVGCSPTGGPAQPRTTAPARAVERADLWIPAMFFGQGIAGLGLIVTACAGRGQALSAPMDGATPGAARGNVASGEVRRGEDERARRNHCRR